MELKKAIKTIEQGRLSSAFCQLYGTDETELSRQKKRYIDAVSAFCKLYPEREEIHLFSASGRTEIGGNHTDHQNGCVLAAAVNLDTIGVVSFHNDGVIRVKSEGYEPFLVTLDEKGKKENENGSASLVRGIADAFLKRGVSVQGFDMYCTSDVLCGSGVSSSAAFEVLVGTVIDKHYAAGKVGAVEVAKIGQFAENVYFGKQSGLMDQMVSSVGGLVSIDFSDVENPKIESFPFDFEKAGYAICLTDTKGSHANLTGDYVAIRSEMESVAKALGCKVLREVDEAAFYNRLPQLRKTCSDRALVRTIHFFDENKRAVLEAKALQNDDVTGFLELVRASGDSSAKLLQNLFTCSEPQNQEIPLALTISQQILGDKGAARVHGGGFAGTIQAFVPLEKLADYKNAMNRLFGDGSCSVLRIRPVGGVEVTEN